MTFPKTQKPPKGFWLLLKMQDNQEMMIGGFTTRAEMEYQLRRRYKNTPGVRFVSSFIHTRRLENYEIEIQEGKQIMTTTATVPVYASFEDLETRYWVDNPKEFEYPWDSAGIRECLAAMQVPFTISKCGESESQFKDKGGNTQVKFWYEITCDVNSEEYQFAFRKSQLLPKYTLTLEAGGPMIAKRRAQMELVKSQIENLGACVAVLAKGGKSGKEYLFRSAPLTSTPGTTETLP